MQRLLVILGALVAGVVSLILLIPILGFIFLLLVSALAFLLLLPLLARLPWFRNRIRIQRFTYRGQPPNRQTWDLHQKGRDDHDVIDVVPQIISSTDEDTDEDEEKPKK